MVEIRNSKLSKTTNTWIDKDLQKLQNEELVKQLEALFGEEEADRFVNPQLQEEINSKTNLQDEIFQKPSNSQGAQTLWNTLRSNSSKKLVHQTKDLHCGFVETVPKDSLKMLNYVEKYRQRVELMHNIAHFNEAKTKQLVQTIKFPSITDSDFFSKEDFEVSKRPHRAKVFFFILLFKFK